MTVQDTMSLRESLQKYKKVAAAVGVAAILVAIGVLFFEIRDSGPVSTEAVSSAFFSSDDGASYFGGSAPKTWELQGKSVPAYAAAVYQTRDGKEKFVAYLTRLAPDALKERNATLEDYNRREPTLQGIEHTKFSEAFGAKMGSIMGRMEIKRPGSQSKWAPLNSPEGQEIQADVTSPKGSKDVKVVYP